MRRLPVLGAAVGLGAGVAVTQHAHRDPIAPWWNERVGASNLRRSDLPVGGTVLALVALRLRVGGHRRSARVVAGIAVGAAVGAVGTGLADPLPSS
jgi:hypothetical protein